MNKKEKAALAGAALKTDVVASPYFIKWQWQISNADRPLVETYLAANPELHKAVFALDLLYDRHHAEIILGMARRWSEGRQ